MRHAVNNLHGATMIPVDKKSPATWGPGFLYEALGLGGAYEPQSFASRVTREEARGTTALTPKWFRRCDGSLTVT